MDHLPEELEQALAEPDAQLHDPDDERRGMDLDEPVPGLAVVEEAPPGEAAVGGAPAVGAAVEAPPGWTVLDRRPAAREPRPYRFPTFERERLDNGLTLIHAHLPGRPLLSAQLVMEGGGSREAPSEAGVTALMARALAEGSQRRDAIELVEAGERLGAELHAEAGWEAMSVGLEVPRSRLAPALDLLAEMALLPSFPEAEVDRLRDERINDLLQVRADPRRRAERVFSEAIYAASAPFSRPLGGVEATVPGLRREQVVARHAAHLDPAGATLIVAGDLAQVPLRELVASTFGDGWAPVNGQPDRAIRPSVDDSAHPDGARLVLVDRPGAAQTEIRIGHVGLRRATPEFHAVAVLSSILGGLFNSRLQRLLREERGYTYGIHAGFDLRRWAGPFAVRTAVQTEVTVPALSDILGELRRIREVPPEVAELREARDYLIGVFPLRFEAAPQVVAAILGLVLFGLPDDELDRYRPGIAAVTADDAARAARHVRPDDASIVLVGDAARIEADVRAAGFGAVTLISD
jgi:zinc protease